jgi:hypothetical protein
LSGENDSPQGLARLDEQLAVPAIASVRKASPWRFELGAAYLYGPVNGFVQTPSGGNPGTTSHRRPRFSEIGISDASIADVGLTLGCQNHEIYAGAQFVGLSGTDTLESALITHGETFPAGSRISSDVSLDWYRLGYRYRWVLDRAANGEPKLTAYPSAGGALFTLDYKLRDDGTRTSRSYSKGLPQLGLELEWRPRGGPFSVAAAGLGFPPLDSIPAIAVERVTAKYRFVHGKGVDVEGMIGVQFEQFRYEDSQRVPNHVEADLGPMLVVGVTTRF